MEGGLEADIAGIVEALWRVYEQAGDRSAAQLLGAAKVGLEVTNYDNWNGGTYTYALKVSVPADRYAALPDQSSVERLEQDLLQRVKGFTRIYPNEYVEDVVVVPRIGDESVADQELVTVPSFWRKGFLRLFVSHVAKIKKEAAALAEQLGTYGISGFVAHEDIKPTREWEDEIRRALNTCDGLAALLTPDFPESKRTDQEVGVAVGRGALVIPIRMGLDPYGFIGRYQAFQGSGLASEALAESIANITARHPQTREKMASALVTVFENSQSFAAAKANVNKLFLIETWTAALADRVRRAVESNEQIANAFYVPGRVNQLLEKAGFPAKETVAFQ